MLLLRVSLVSVSPDLIQLKYSISRLQWEIVFISKQKMSPGKIQEFGSVKFYQVDPDYLDMEPPENTIKQEIINNTSDNRILQFWKLIFKFCDRTKNFLLVRYGSKPLVFFSWFVKIIYISHKDFIMTL